MNPLRCFSRPLAGVPLLCMMAMLACTPAARCEDDEEWQIPVTMGKDGWMSYTNGRFGCSLIVPAGMVPLRPPDNGDGQAFATPDGRVKLSVYGCFNVEGAGDLETRWKWDLAEKGRTITYKRKTDTWYVVSGIMADGTGFYERYTSNSKYGSGWNMTYPQAEEKKYAAWIERIAKSYEPRFGKGFDTVD
ncbi:MAG TPA: hypothetical protein VGE29_03430 [Prosthecobacter sp.]